MVPFLLSTSQEPPPTFSIQTCQHLLVSENILIPGNVASFLKFYRIGPLVMMSEFQGLQWRFLSCYGVHPTEVVSPQLLPLVQLMDTNSYDHNGPDSKRCWAFCKSCWLWCGMYSTLAARLFLLIILNTATRSFQGLQHFRENIDSESICFT